tara:strand:+ start:16551 stop:18263 length:1713 start_codon:yes stop_codon:yes gene_type:complete
MGKKLLIALTVGLLASCDSGDIVISPSTADNSTDSSVNNSNNTTTTPVVDDNPCASYEEGGETFEGSFDGLDCTYSVEFAAAGNSLTTDVTIPRLNLGGVNIFEGSLMVGTSYDTDADLAANGITQGGDGPTLTVEAGATVAFISPLDFLAVNRGSQIIAQGTQSRPITFTSLSDVQSARAVANGLAATLDPEADTQWGGLVINGFGYTNKCASTGSIDGGDLAGSECHIDAEGSEGDKQTSYGGFNNADNSGILEYVVVKHTGGEVVPGDDLNGISFGGVGSGTTVNYLETYSTFDDGIEMFGGAVNISNFLGLYVKDDSIDIDEGYRGTITNALVIQSETDGNHCIESDGIGSYSSRTEDFRADIVARGLNSRPVIRNLTCIISAVDGTRGDGAGWRMREGLFPIVEDSMVVTVGADDAAANNYCVRVDNDEGLNEITTSLGEADRSARLFDFNSVLFVCADRVRTVAEADVVALGAQFAQDAGLAVGLDPTAAADTQLIVLEGSLANSGFYSPDYDDVIIDDASGTAPAPVNGDHVGGVIQGAAGDWTLTWTYGLHAGNRGKPLWIP